MFFYSTSGAKCGSPLRLSYGAHGVSRPWRGVYIFGQSYRGIGAPGGSSDAPSSLIGNTENHEQRDKQHGRQHQGDIQAFYGCLRHRTHCVGESRPAQR